MFASDENLGDKHWPFIYFFSVKAGLDVIFSLSCSLDDATAGLPCN